MKCFLLPGMMAILSLAPSAANASFSAISYRDFGLNDPGAGMIRDSGSITSPISEERSLDGNARGDGSLTATVKKAYGRTESYLDHTGDTSGRRDGRHSDSGDRSFPYRDRHAFERHGEDTGSAVSPIPVPASILLLGSGLACVVALRRRLL